MYGCTVKTGTGGNFYFILLDDDGKIILSPNSVIEIEGDEAHGAAASGNPVRLGLTYQDTTPSSVDDGDVDEWRSDGKGRAYFVDGGLQEIEVITSGDYTATQSSGNQNNPGAKGMLLIVNVTAGTPNLDVKVEAKVPSVSTWFDWCTVTASIAATGQYVYLIYPSNITIPASGTGITEGFEIPAPSTWKATITHNDANSITYSVQVIYLL